MSRHTSVRFSMGGGGGGGGGRPFHSLVPRLPDILYAFNIEKLGIVNEARYSYLYGTEVGTHLLDSAWRFGGGGWAFAD